MAPHPVRLSQIVRWPGARLELTDLTVTEETS